jgi:hypothetical protein
MPRCDAVSHAIGDIVNAASRLENLTKEFDAELIVSAEVLAGLDQLGRRRAEIAIRGKQEKLMVVTSCQRERLIRKVNEIKESSQSVVPARFMRRQPFLRLRRLQRRHRHLQNRHALGPLLAERDDAACHRLYVS